MAHIVDWVAALVGGRTLKRRERMELGAIPAGHLECVNLETDHSAIPLIRLELTPERGDSAHAFTRTMTHPAGKGSVSVPVVEVRPDPADPTRFVRVYVLPDRLVVSTRDLYW